MNNDQIIAEFKEILRPYTKNTTALDALSEQTDFINDLKINSANIVDVFLDTEEKFDIEINNDSLEKIKNVGDAVNVISEKMKEKNITV